MRLPVQRRATVRIRVRGQVNPAWAAAIARLDALLNSPDLITQITRRAIAETLLRAYRQRFLDALPTMINMERVNNPHMPVSFDPQIKQRLDEAADRFSLSHVAGDAAEQAAAEKAFDRAANKAAVNLRRAHSSPLATGMYRKLALAILERLTVANHIGVLPGQAGALVFGVGNLASLNKIETPSATSMLTGHQTQSSMKILWRQLEFGTGIYATDRSVNSGSKAKALASKMGASGGAWFYGIGRQKYGILLKGNKPGHVLFKNAQGLPYEGDAPLLARRFGELLTQALIS